MKKLLTGLSFAVVLGAVGQDNAEDDKLLQNIQRELDKNLKYYKEQTLPISFLSYRIEDTETYNIYASSEYIERTRKSKERLLIVQMSVGTDKSENNTHKSKKSKNKPFITTVTNIVKLPLNDNAESIEQILRQETDRIYKDAVKKHTTIVKSGVADLEINDDYSDFPRKEYYEKPLSINSLNSDISQWEEKLKNYTRQFAKKKGIIESSVNVSFSIVRKYFVSSSGKSIVENTSTARLLLDTKTKDGSQTVSKSYSAMTLNDLPSDDKILADFNIKTPASRRAITKAQRKEQLLSQLDASIAVYLSTVQAKCAQTRQKLAKLEIYMAENKGKKSRDKNDPLEQILQQRITSLQKREKAYTKMENQASEFQSTLQSRESKNVAPSNKTENNWEQINENQENRTNGNALTASEREMISNLSEKSDKIQELQNTLEDKNNEKKNTATQKDKPTQNAIHVSDNQLKTTVQTPSVVQPVTIGYYIIFGSFKDKDNAERFYNDLKKQYPNLSIINDNDFYMIGIGPYTNKEKAFAEKPAGNSWIKKIGTDSSNR